VAAAFAVLESVYAGMPVRVADAERGVVSAYRDELDVRREID